ncbi:MAG: tRNA (guanosine(46)-N7)-methyltransferase TrmB [Verrucomicrobiales bacterium]
MPKDPFPFPNELYPKEWFARLDRREIFDDARRSGEERPEDRPIELDLGSGDGSFLVRMAKELPDRDFLGVERLLGRVRKTCRKAARLDLSNVRVLRTDSNYAVEWLLPRGFARRIHFLCPDPWPKKKHASRRQMCRLDFLGHLHSLLEEGGELLFKTDSSDYFAEALEVQADCDFFVREPWEDDDFFYAESDFERQWLAEGRSMHRLRLRKT